MAGGGGGGRSERTERRDIEKGFLAGANGFEKRETAAGGGEGERATLQPLAASFSLSLLRRCEFATAFARREGGGGLSAFGARFPFSLYVAVLLFLLELVGVRFSLSSRFRFSSFAFGRRFSSPLDFVFLPNPLNFLKVPFSRPQSFFRGRARARQTTILQPTKQPPTHPQQKLRERSQRAREFSAEEKEERSFSFHAFPPALPRDDDVNERCDWESTRGEGQPPSPRSPFLFSLEAKQ